MIQNLPETPLQRLIAAVLRRVLRMLLRPTFRAGLPVARQRRRLERIARLTLPARGVDSVAATVGGVRGELLNATGNSAPAGALLYLHGGAYCVGSPATHRSITTRLARLTQASVFAADYRLAPEHPFPAAVDDAVAAYRGLLAAGWTTDRIAIAGDSAGGGLALATLLRLRQLEQSLPAALVVFSPWVDLGHPERGPEPAGEVMVSLPWVDECARWYLGGQDARNPLASPIHGDLGGFPPTLLQVGTDEILLQDSRRLQAALAAAAVDVTYQEYPRRWHVFQSNAGVLADADRALRSAAEFILACWGRPRLR